MYRITLIPGDGIGPEVMDAALHVLEASNLEFDYKKAWAGNACFYAMGTTIPDETIEMARKADATLFGAVTTVPGQKSAIITLRKVMNLYANLRPVKSYPGVKSIYSDLDFIIVRENSEGLYSGKEDYIRGGEGALALRVITRNASERICRFAFEQAIKTDRNKVTAVHKANVLRKTDGIFRKAFWKVADGYPGIEAEEMYVDAAAMFMVTQPHRFQVLVTTNLFGDILSDEAAGLVGGLGMVPSANIGDENGLFEPVHGSAPDIAGQGIANPTAMILSVSLMLQYLEEYQESLKLEEALFKVLEEGKVLTPDLGGASSTKKMAAEVRKNLEKVNRDYSKMGREGT
jgi:isopropylmalate/isohomocitrate dehydrogenase-like protein